MAVLLLLILSLSSLALALDNGLAARPGLGWNSDYCTKCAALSGSPRLTGFENEKFIAHIADFLVSSGLAALGYVNVNMDSLWDLPTRSADGDLQPDPALWPSGLPATISYVHSKGLKFGVYGDRCVCAR
jgi:alpha-galactosidase